MKGRNRKPHFHVAAGVIWREGRVLITRRPKGSHLEGLWEFPGGKLKEGETLEGCLEREIKEELDLTVKAGQALLTVDHDYGSKVISLHIFHCTCVEGEPRALEGQEVRWVDPVDLERYPLPPPDRGVIGILSCREERPKKES